MVVGQFQQHNEAMSHLAPDLVIVVHASSPEV